MSRGSHTVLAVIWGILTLIAGYFALAVYGLSQLDTGTPNLTPPIVALLIFPFVLLLSCVGQVLAARGSAGPTTRALSLWIPILNALVIVMFVLMRGA